MTALAADMTPAAPPASATDTTGAWRRPSGASQERHFFYLGGSDKLIYEMTNSTPPNDSIYPGDELIAEIQGVFKGPGSAALSTRVRALHLEAWRIGVGIGAGLWSRSATGTATKATSFLHSERDHRDAGNGLEVAHIAAGDAIAKFQRRDPDQQV